MTTVRKLLEAKPDAPLFTVNANDTVLQALKVMGAGNSGAVLVTEDEKIIGIFTERDYARRGELAGRVAKDTLVREVMTRELVMIKPETTLQQCAELMRAYHVRHLPVLEDERVIGIVSLRRLAEGLIEVERSTVVELENYIMGTGYGR